MAMAVLSDKLYVSLKDGLKDRSILADATRLLTETELSRRYGVAVGTLRKAVSRLEEEMLVERQQGRGTFIVERPYLPTLKATVTFCLYCQKEINALLFASDVELTEMPPLGAMPPEQADAAIQDSDLLFLSNSLIYAGRRENRFSPAPHSLAKKVEQDYPAEIVDAFRSSLTGELLALPLIANPSVCFINTGLLNELRIEPPPHDWNWDDFIALLRRIKAHDVMPFLYLPSSGHFIEPFLRQAGGSVFDFFGNPSLEPEALSRFVELFKTMTAEGLAANGLAARWPYDKLLTNGKAAITICAPHLAMRIPPEQRHDWSYWELPADKNSGGSSTLFGIAVPAASRNRDRAWEYLEENYHRGLPCAIATLPGIFPAQRAAQKQWKGVLDNDYVMSKEADRAEPLPFKNIGIWHSETLLRLFAETMNRIDDIQELRQEMLRKLREPETT